MRTHAAYQPGSLPGVSRSKEHALLIFGGLPA